MAQPATDYYAWQVEVTLKRSLDLGYNGNYIDIVCAFQDSIPESWLKLQQAYPYVRFFFYSNEIPNCNYAPAIQAHIMSKHFKAHSYLKNEAIFFYDCDFVFTKYFDFTPYLNDDIWYMSDVKSYIGADYIESKGEGLLEGMCSVVGLCPCKVRANKEHTGGAQKLMKNLTYEYWDDVEMDSIYLYNWLLQNKDNYGDSGRNNIQIWTSSMWAELWNAWKMGVTVRTPKEFDFCWATCHTDKWDKMSFFHNAGVVNDKSGMFFKAKYIDALPYDEELDLSNERCSYRYFDLIKKTGVDSVLK